MEICEMKKEMTYSLYIVNILLSPSLLADTIDPVTLVENIKTVYPGNHLYPAYALSNNNLSLLRIEGNDVTDTGVDGSDFIKVIPSSFRSFAALTASNNVITITDSTNNTAIITNVTDLQAIQGGFAALRSDGTIVTWNDQVPPYQCQTHLNNVKRIITSPEGYGAVALHGDGTISAWSYDICSGFSVKEINAIDVAVGTYGFTVLDYKGIASQYPYDTKNIVHHTNNIERVISGNNYGLSLNNESINCGGAIVNADGKSSLQVSTASGTGMMMLQMSDGTVTQSHCYGSTLNNLSEMTLQSLHNIKNIVSNYNGFTALDTSGNIFTWGGYNSEYDNNKLNGTRSNIASIIPMMNSFAALKYDGTVIAWGEQMDIKNGSQRHLNNIIGVYPSSGRYLALSKEGKLYSFN